MKAPVRAARRIPQQKRRRVRAYSTLMYRAHKEVNPAEKRSPDLLSSRLSYPRPVLLRLVSLEASRLSKTNRLKVITLQEIQAAASHVRRRICTRAAA
ncbi:Histone H2B [Scomber scombrus]|uniref:Histone H2B n=1 Tax=Scomber scombrus TaxID=13677 RepID=A0AAV1PHD4_SCOSC